MINTKAYRQQTIDTLHNNIAIINAMCDELDRLYLDHTPLSREELETVLKEEGWELDSKHVLRYKNESHTGYVYIEENDATICYGTFALPLSSVTRAMLRSCGVIK